MASGFIYLIILGMWMAYFLPRWVTSHDQASGKSAERYKSAMRVVGEAPTNVEDVAAVLAGLASPPPELHAAMERHGVLPPVTVYIEK